MATDKGYVDAMRLLHQRLEAMQARAAGGREVEREGIAHTARLLRHLCRNVDEVVRMIHDVWNAGMLARGFDVEQELVEGRRPLPQPLDACSPEWITVETELARGDVESIFLALEQTYPADWLGSPADGRPPGAAAEAIQRTLLRLAGDDAFLLRVAPLVHDRWRQIKLAAGYRDDERLSLPFAAMSPEQQQVTLRNVRGDLLAVALLA